MFREFVIPCLRNEMRRLDGVEYHLDGPFTVIYGPDVPETPAVEVPVFQHLSNAGMITNNSSAAVSARPALNAPTVPSATSFSYSSMEDDLVCRYPCAQRCDGAPGWWCLR